MRNANEVLDAVADRLYSFDRQIRRTENHIVVSALSPADEPSAVPSGWSAARQLSTFVYVQPGDCVARMDCFRNAGRPGVIRPKSQNPLQADQIQGDGEPW
jgi:hypothetical protein